MAQRIREAGVAAEVIGRVTKAEEGVRIVRESGTEPLRRFDSDEITRIFEAEE